MRGHGGFDHNTQSLRIVEIIEQKYPRFAGLNLTWEVREGLRKHAKFHESPKSGEKRANPSLEAQIANLADEITYYSHDLDDGIDAGLITPKQLAELEVWQTAESHVRRHFPKLTGSGLVTYIIRCIIDRQVEDVLLTSAARISKAKVASADDVRKQPRPLIRYSDGLLSANRKLRRFLYKNLYYHPQVEGLNRRACDLLARVFEEYLRKPSQLGQRSAKRVRKDGLHRTVCDFVSGMTDRYLIKEHERLFGTGL
jgi:dGTPase